MSNEERVTYFAKTDSRNRQKTFGIKAKDRSRHVYVIGKTGMGKSTLLENMAIQDLRNGEGIAFIDPHGKTADLLLDYVPEERLDDVVYFAPFDMEHPLSFNVMEDVGADKRHLVASGLMSSFKKIWIDAWSARMEYILNNILLALLEYPDSTLMGVNRMLADKDYRKKVVENVTDTSVRAFWTDEFAKYGERYMQEAGAAIQNKIGQFISNPVIRNIIGQPHSSFDLRRIMDERKIVIINLSKGRVGETNANLLGGMLITKMYLSAMSRADTDPETMEKLPNFYLFVDEFQSFANESFADILSEARKYKLNLTMAHQYIEQMDETVRAAVFGNVGTMITFRVGAYDAEFLEKEFEPVFDANDLVNLGFAQIYLKLMIDGVSSPPFSAITLPPLEEKDTSHRNEVIDASRANYSKSREEVEKSINEWQGIHVKDYEESPADKQQKKKPKRDQQKDQQKDPSKAQGTDRQRGEARPQSQHSGHSNGASQKPAEGKSSDELRAALAAISKQVSQGQKTDQTTNQKENKSKQENSASRSDRKRPRKDTSGTSLKDALKERGLLGSNDSAPKEKEEVKEQPDKSEKMNEKKSKDERDNKEKDQQESIPEEKPKEKKFREVPREVLDELLGADEDDPKNAKR
ncbi:MAG: type IV secretory system conjugative DNA transfer family protein [Candidatus Paceibacterota bacterium]